MDKRDVLKSMLNNIINDKTEQAQLDLHTYLTAKMRDITGLSQAVNDVGDLEQESYEDSIEEITKE
jgi:uncharacterized membrane protein